MSTFFPGTIFEESAGNAFVLSRASVRNFHPPSVITSVNMVGSVSGGSVFTYEGPSLAPPDLYTGIYLSWNIYGSPPGSPTAPGDGEWYATYAAGWTYSAVTGQMSANMGGGALGVTARLNNLCRPGTWSGYVWIAIYSSYVALVSAGRVDPAQMQAKFQLVAADNGQVVDITPGGGWFQVSTASPYDGTANKAAVSFSSVTSFGRPCYFYAQIVTNDFTAPVTWVLPAEASSAIGWGPAWTMSRTGP